MNFIFITVKCVCAIDGFFVYAHSGKWLEDWGSIHNRGRECTLHWNFRTRSTAHITAHLMGKLFPWERSRALIPIQCPDECMELYLRFPIAWRLDTWTILLFPFNYMAVSNWKLMERIWKEE
jgi:hypothetical protein